MATAYSASWMQAFERCQTYGKSSDKHKLETPLDRPDSKLNQNQMKNLYEILEKLEKKDLSRGMTAHDTMMTIREIICRFPRPSEIAYLQTLASQKNRTPLTNNYYMGYLDIVGSRHAIGQLVGSMGSNFNRITREHDLMYMWVYPNVRTYVMNPKDYGDESKTSRPGTVSRILMYATDQTAPNGVYKKGVDKIHAAALNIVKQISWIDGVEHVLTSRPGNSHDPHGQNIKTLEFDTKAKKDIPMDQYPVDEMFEGLGQVIKSHPVNVDDENSRPRVRSHPVNVGEDEFEDNTRVSGGSKKKTSRAPAVPPTKKKQQQPKKSPGKKGAAPPVPHKKKQVRASPSRK